MNIKNKYLKLSYEELINKLEDKHDQLNILKTQGVAFAIKNIYDHPEILDGFDPVLWDQIQDAYDYFIANGLI